MTAFEVMDLESVRMAGGFVGTLESRDGFFLPSGDDQLVPAAGFPDAMARGNQGTDFGHVSILQ